MTSILSIFEQKYVFLALYALMGYLVGVCLKILSVYVTHQIEQALAVTSKNELASTQAGPLGYPTVKLLPRLEPLLPIVMAGLAIMLGAFTPFDEAVLWFVFVALCLLMAAIDARTGILPNLINLPLIAIGLAWQVGFKGGMQILGIVAQAEYDWAMGLGYGVPILLAWLYGKVRHITPMGQGDAKMLAGLGAWLGLNGLAGAVVVASLAASFWVLTQMWRGQHQTNQAIPFGPFLALGGLTVVLWSISYQHA